MTSPQSQNPYVYCVNNPLRYIDPSGMDSSDSTYEDIRIDNGDGNLVPLYTDSSGNVHYATQDVVLEWIQEAMRADATGHPPGGYCPDCATYGGGGALGAGRGGGGHAQTPGTTWWKDMDDPYGAYNGHPVDPNLIEVGVEINFLFLSGSICAVYNPITNEWSDVQGGATFGFTQVSVIGYAVDTPFDSFEEYNAYYANHGHLDIDVVCYAGFKGRHYEGYGWEGGIAGGWSPEVKNLSLAANAMANAVRSFSISGGGSVWP